MPAARRLSELAVGETGVICDAQMDPSDGALLRAMGLAVSARIRLCRQGEPCIVAVMASGGACQGGGEGAGALPCCSSRIGLARALATRILVVADHPGKAAG